MSCNHDNTPTETVYDEFAALVEKLVVAKFHRVADILEANLEAAGVGNPEAKHTGPFYSSPRIERPNCFAVSSGALSAAEAAASIASQSAAIWSSGCVASARIFCTCESALIASPLHSGPDAGTSDAPASTVAEQGGVSPAADGAGVTTPAPAPHPRFVVVGEYVYDRESGMVASFSDAADAKSAALWMATSMCVLSDYVWEASR